MSDTIGPSGDAAASKTEPHSRRTALQLLTGSIAVLINAVPITLGGLYFLNPLFRRRSRSGPDTDNATDRTDGGPEDSIPYDFLQLRVNADSVPPDGTPVPVTVIADVRDAWTLYKDEPMGSIWLRRKADGTIVAFNSICPHLGCSVDYRSSENDFYCPCHTSAFDLDGARTNQVPPRGMDRLEIKTATEGRPDPAGMELWVRYQIFRTGIEEQIPV